MRTDRLLIICAIGALLSGGCAFTDGDPWGTAEWSVEARLDEAGRTSAEGLRTSDDFRVQLDTLSWSIVSAQLGYAAGGSVEGFDPADPPPGYSLCHNGHCHADSGELVDYEDIAAELAAASGQGGVTITQAIDTSLALETTTAALPLGDCSNDCRLQRGRIATATLQTGDLRVVATVTDAREGEDNRLGGEALAIDVLIPATLALQSALDLELDGRKPPALRFEASLQLDAGLFDDTPWSAEPETLRAALAANLGEHATLTLTTTRADF